jgi:hypothetical protein
LDVIWLVVITTVMLVTRFIHHCAFDHRSFTLHDRLLYNSIQQLSISLFTMKPEDFEIDKSNQFTPTNDLYLTQHTGLSKDICITETTEFGEILYTIKRKGVVATHFTVLDPSGNQIGELRSSVLSLGKSKLHFANTQHATHDIEVKPTSLGRRALVFTIESAPYFWVCVDSMRGSCGKSLAGRESLWGDSQVKRTERIQDL